MKATDVTVVLSALQVMYFHLFSQGSVELVQLARQAGLPQLAAAVVRASRWEAGTAAWQPLLAMSSM